MCNLESLIPTAYTLAIFKFAAGLYIMYCGGMFIASTPIQMAYSINFIDIGGSLLSLGLFSLLFTVPFVFGVKKHNRFVLVFVFCIDVIFFAQLLNLGVRTLNYTNVIHPKDLQDDCLRTRPLKYTEEECDAFRKHDKTSGFRLLWTYLFSVRDEPLQFQTVAQIQLASSCCGFFSPMELNHPDTGCREIELPFPDGYPADQLPAELVSQRLKCSIYPGFYLEQSDCVSYYDVTVIPPIIGGCNYDLGVGPCMELAVTPSSKGCASAVEDYAATLITGSGYGVMGAAFFNFLAMFLSCCVWWKRKSEDVFPDFLREEKVDKIDYLKIKDQFTVQPLEHSLQLRGFTPTDERTGLPPFMKYAVYDEFKPKGPSEEELKFQAEEEAREQEEARKRLEEEAAKELEENVGSLGEPGSIGGDNV